MDAIYKLLPFFKPYWRRSVVALLFLTGVVIMDLSIPRLIERIIDQGIGQNNNAVVIQTSIIMLTLSALSTAFAIGNNNLSVQVGESIARDLREAGVDILTMGQYLAPTGNHHPVRRYYTPEEFAALGAHAKAMGFHHVESAPLVRSSYMAHRAMHG